jgi:molybdenum cofactor sulfurtransferase
LKLFEIVFVANATAGIKLVAEGFAGSPNGFRYRYLRGVHTSIIGAGNLAQFMEEHEVNKWLASGNLKSDDQSRPAWLFVYPALLNFNGRRLPLEWIRRLRENCPGWYSSDATAAPDFTVMSFYKIFGYPDLGAIFLRKGDVGHMLIQRHFFGGGSRTLLTVEGFNQPRDVLHEALEDGTLPFHTIMAIEAFLNTYARLFGSQINVARLAALITRLVYTLLWSLQYPNGQPVCQLYLCMRPIYSILFVISMYFAVW